MRWCLLLNEEHISPSHQHKLESRGPWLPLWFAYNFTQTINEWILELLQRTQAVMELCGCLDTLWQRQPYWRPAGHHRRRQGRTYVVCITPKCFLNNSLDSQRASSAAAVGITRHPVADSCPARIIDFIILGFVSVINAERNFCQVPWRYGEVSSAARLLKRLKSGASGNWGGTTLQAGGLTYTSG